MRQGKGQFKNIEFEMKFLGDLLSSVRGYVIGYTGDTRQAGYAALFCGGIAVVTAAALIFSRLLEDSPEDCLPGSGRNLLPDAVLAAGNTYLFSFEES